MNMINIDPDISLMSREELCREVMRLRSINLFTPLLHDEKGKPLNLPDGVLSGNCERYLECDH